MDSYLLLTLAIALMFTGGHCYSESMSCISVNGRTICEKQTSSGNTAGAFSGATVGRGSVNGDVEAMTGNTYTGRSQASRTVVDGQTFRGFRVPNFYPNSNDGWTNNFGHLVGTGASDATSFRSNTRPNGISTSGFAGNSNNNGIPGPAFGGFAVADSSGNNFYAGGNTYGGGYAHGYGDPNAFRALHNVLPGIMAPGFPFNIFGRKR